MASAFSNTGALSLERGELRPVAVLARELTGRRPSAATTSRWCTTGTQARGRLPAVHVYGSWHTSLDVLRAWLLQTAQSNTEESTPTGGAQ